MNSSPKLTVLLPVHNGMPYLPATIESLRDQTLRDFDLVVVDDGSTDDTARYLRSVEDPRLIVHRLEKAGQANAMNFGLREARTDLVLRIDADDIALPDRLAMQYGRMMDQPHLVMLGCQAGRIDEKGELKGDLCFPSEDDSIRWAFAFTCPFLHPGVAYRRGVILGVGGYSGDLEPAEDYHLWTKIAGKGKLANLSNCLMHYREHSENVTLRKWERGVANASIIAASYINTLFQAPEVASMGDLHKFARFGREPDIRSSAPMAVLFRGLVRYFNAAYPSMSVELRSAIAGMERVLRWRCISAAQKSLRHPKRAARWIGSAGRFDPEGGRVAGMAFRWARSLARRGHLLPTARSIVSDSIR